MRIRSVTYGRNMSVNYQSRRAEVTIELSEGEDFATAAQLARDLVNLELHDLDWLGEQPGRKEIDAARERVAAYKAALPQANR